MQPVLAGVLGFLLFPPFEVAIAIGVFFAMTATVITGCVAYPLLLMLINRGQLTRRRTLVAGVLLGNIPAAIAGVLMIVSGSHDPALASLIPSVTVGTLTGGISAAAFWVLSGRHLK